MRQGFQNGLPFGNSGQGHQQLNNMLNYFGISFNQTGYPAPVNLMSNPMFGSNFTWNHPNVIPPLGQPAQEKQEAPRRQEEPSQVPPLEMQKKLKLPRCSVCLKKIVSQELFTCHKCTKTFHQVCEYSEKQCFRCQEKEKLKEIKRDKKMMKKNQKKLIMPSHLNTAQMIEKMPFPVDLNLTNVSKIGFFIKFPYYCSGSEVLYPVEDTLFDQYSDILTPEIQNPRPKFLPLPPYYGDLLQIWNMMITFPHFFGTSSQLHINELQKKLIAPQIDSQFQISLLKFANFNLRDAVWEKLEQYREHEHFSFLSLLRFSFESGFLQKVLKYCWPKLLKVVFDLQQLVNPDSDDDDTNKECFQDQKFKSSKSGKGSPRSNNFQPNFSMRQRICKMDDLGEFKFFSDVKQRFDFLTTLTVSAVDTNSFRSLLNQKNDLDKENNKQKNQWVQARKRQEGKLSVLKEKQKHINRQQRKGKKLLKKNISEGEEVLRAVQQAQIQLNEERQFIIQTIKEIDVEIDSMSGFSGFSHVWFVGKDKHKDNYWFTLDQKDRLIVNSGGVQWGYYPFNKIPQFLGSLNQNGIRQKQLYDSIIEYRGLSDSTNEKEIEMKEDWKDSVKEAQRGQDQNKIEEQGHQSCSPNLELKNSPSEKPSVNYESSHFDYPNLNSTSLQTIRSIILQGQRRMTKYLQERNARWANESDRAKFIQKISTEFQELPQFLSQLRTFNERICVVEVQYKIVLENSDQQIDSRTRKIQTKIWGINQKYKHNWFDYARNYCETFSDLFFLVSVLYLNIQKYVSKSRKLRKEYQEVKGPFKHLKTKSAREYGDERWEQECEICSGYGELLCCDTCPKVFHLECIKLEQVPHQQFKCEGCLKKRSTRSQAKRR